MTGSGLASGGGGGGAGADGFAVDSAGAALVGTGWALVGALDGTIVDSSAPVARLRTTSRTSGTAIATAAAAISSVFTRLFRYQGCGLDTVKFHAPIRGVPFLPLWGAVLAGFAPHIVVGIIAGKVIGFGCRGKLGCPRRHMPPVCVGIVLPAFLRIVAL